MPSLPPRPIPVKAAAENCVRHDAKARKKQAAKGRGPNEAPKGGWALPVEWSSSYGLLMTTLTRLRRDWRIPLVVFHPPAPAP